MANRYWVGNGGSWSDTAHWSTTSGGSGGAGIPGDGGVADDVIFDANSFTLDNQRVTSTIGTGVNTIQTSSCTHSPHLLDESDTATYNNTLVVLGDTCNLSGVATSRMYLSLVPIFVSVNVTPGTNSFSRVSIAGVLGSAFFLGSIGVSGEFSVSTSGGVTSIGLNGNPLNTQNFTVSGTPALGLDNSTITVTGTLSISPGANISATGTTWILGSGSTTSIDGTSSAISLLGSSTSNRLTITNNSGSTQTISNSTLSNTILNGTNGFRLVEVIDDGGNDWGDGGGGTGNPTRLYHVKIPPTYVALP